MSLISTLNRYTPGAHVGAFFDDSGTHAGSPALVLGGVLGTDAQWDRFAVAWQALLQSPLPEKPPLSSFHLTECRNGFGEFADYRQADRDRITYLFRRIIVDLEMVTVAAAVDKRAWEEIVIGDLRAAIGDPIGYCFVRCVDQVLRTIRERRPDEKLMLFFDQGVRFNLEQWGRFYQTQPHRYPEIESITFAPVKKVYALQAADMIALETYQYAQQCLDRGEDAVANPHFREFLRRELSIGFLLDRAEIAVLADRIRQSGAG